MKRKTVPAQPKRRTKAPVTEVVAGIATLPKNQVLTLKGLTGSNSGGGTSLGRSASKWRFVSQFAAWKTEDGPLVRETLQVWQSGVTNRKLKSLMRTFTPLTQLIIRAKIIKPRGEDGLVAEIIRVVGSVTDKDLAAVARELKRPVTHKDSVFGRLRLSRDMGVYEGNIGKGNNAVRVWFDTESPEVLPELITHAKPFWKARAPWLTQVKEYAARKLLRVGWQHSRVPKPTQKDLIEKMKLCQIDFIPERRGMRYVATLDVGDMLGGHQVVVFGKPNQKPRDMDVIG